DDAELSQVTGQALFVMDKQVVGNYTFYKVGLDATLEFDANIASLDLGCTGAAINGQHCDISATNVSFGCMADSSGNCITSQSAGDTAGNRAQMKSFTINRPFIQLVVKNDSDPSSREIAGVRLGGASVVGPLSFGQMTSFSGFLSAVANVTLQGQTDIAATCGTTTKPCTGTAQTKAGWCCGWNANPTADGHNQFTNGTTYEEPPTNNTSLGLNDDFACVLGVCQPYDAVTVNYSTVPRTNLPISLTGSRQTQAFIQGLNLGDTVHTLIYGNGGSIAPLSINQSKGFAGSGLLNAVISAIQGQMENKIDNQLATGLGLPTSTTTSTVRATLNAYNMPYNLSNLHQVDVNSSNFGLSFQKEAGIQYPDYTQVMNQGWSLNLPNAFTLNVSQPTVSFVSNILQGYARQGNIIGLPPSYVNCWGTATFC
ncbi:MAG TPA: hypothetical protein VFM34_10535, partial [Moraxellaceae bacterium]|nr:hypothetical protein [Moraxellaceae bacterium]